MLTAEQSILNYKNDLAKDPRNFLYVIDCPVCNSKNTLYGGTFYMNEKTLNPEVRELIKCFNCNELTRTENLYKTLKSINL